MSTAARPHEGSAFFPLPDGTGLLYRLIGRAETPVAEGKLQKTVAAKIHHVEILKVNNWLHRPQRFKAIVNKVQVEKGVLITCQEYIDVPALSSKDYKLTIYSFVQGTATLNVQFQNPDTSEYMFYEVKYTFGPAQAQGTISMECPVRSLTTHTLTLKNPMTFDATLKCTATHKQVAVKDAVVLKAGSSADIEVKFRPLLVGEAEAMLKVESAELGIFDYMLKLKGTPTNPEKQIGFSVPLGSRDTRVMRFSHWCNERVDYKCSWRSGSSAFECPATVTAQPAPVGGSIEVEVEVHFEPNTVGENIRDTLIISSPVGGEYTCPVIGRCIPPKPQGPLDISKGSGNVPFKNVFSKEAEFLFAVDNPSFSVKPSERITSKKVTNIAVSFKGDSNSARTGKLSVTCPSMTNAVWSFYLQA